MQQLWKGRGCGGDGGFPAAHLENRAGHQSRHLCHDDGLCLWLLTPHRNGDINLSSAWECSRNDIYEGFAVLLAAFAVWVFGTGWPDLVIASALLLMFLRSASRVLRGAWRELRGATPAPSACELP